MSKRYEFLEGDAEVITGADLADLNEDYIDLDEAIAQGQVALVLGNPYATAGVLFGSRESIAATLRGWLALVEEAA